MNDNLKRLTGTALMTAVLCILGPLSLPIGPVPISLTNLTIYLFLYLLDTKQATAAYVIYLLLGAVGLPVFSGYAGGVPKIVGPTGGYLIGFIPMIIVAGIAVKAFRMKQIPCVLALEAATWIAYALGTGWLACSTGMTFQAALAAGVIPFILIDLAKIVICAVLGPVLYARVRKAVPNT